MLLAPSRDGVLFTKETGILFKVAISQPASEFGQQILLISYYLQSSTLRNLEVTLADASFTPLLTFQSSQYKVVQGH